MGLASRIMQQRYIQIDISVVPVCEPPSWISDFRSLNELKASSDLSSMKTSEVPLECHSYDVYMLRY